MKYYAGIDLGGTFVKCGIVDGNGKIIAKDKIPTGAEREYTLIARDMAELAVGLAAKSGVKIEAVGIGAPGTIDSENGVVVYSNNIKWKNVPLAAEMSRLMSIATAMTNDANAAALGESYAGAGRNYKSSVFITLGTGVGGGIVLDGKLYEGGRSAGAEIGHILVKPNGRRCTCGRRGCLEAYASASALVRSTKRAMLRDRSSALWRLVCGDVSRVDGKTAFDGMAAGDPAATRVVDEYIGYLADGIADIVNVLRPDVVLIGGGVSAQGETLLGPLRERVRRDVFGGMDYAETKILAASLGNDAGIIGAARLAMIKSAE